MNNLFKTIKDFIKNVLIEFLSDNEVKKPEIILDNTQTDYPITNSTVITNIIKLGYTGKLDYVLVFSWLIRQYNDDLPHFKIEDLGDNNEFRITTYHRYKVIIQHCIFEGDFIDCIIATIDYNYGE